MENKVYIGEDFGWFLGSFENNQDHRHYAMQLSIPLRSSMIIEMGELSIQTDSPVLIPSQLPHCIKSSHPHFLLLINPASTIGHFWKQFANLGIREFTDSPALELQNLLLQVPPAREINEFILSHDCYCSSSLHEGDERINRALSYLKENSERTVPLEETAAHCNLSPGRFLHLFKSETGITYRRAQLWIKLVQAVPHFGKMSLTGIAHETGFADSAHFSRVFKETFGFTPRDFSRISRFIQV